MYLVMGSSQIDGSWNRIRGDSLELNHIDTYISGDVHMSEDLNVSEDLYVSDGLYVSGYRLQLFIGGAGADAGSG